MKANFLLILFCFAFLIPHQGKAQYLSISGFVKNHFNGEVKKNATVYESISGIGTITNSEGYYRLLLTGGRQNLEISSPGFKTYASKFNLINDTIVSVELIPQVGLTEGGEADYSHFNVPFTDTGKVPTETK